MRDFIKTTETVYKTIELPNYYGDEELARDIEELKKIFPKATKNLQRRGYIQNDGDNSRPTSGRIGYLPRLFRKLWRTHLIMSTNEIYGEMYREDKKKLDSFLNKRFGVDNWFYDRHNSPKIVLIKNILDKPVSNQQNKWKCKLSQDRKKILLIKVPEDKVSPAYIDIVSDEKLSKGFFYHLNDGGNQ